MNKNNDFIQIGIDYSGTDEDKHCAVLNLYYNDTSHIIYETFDKEQIKALDNVLKNTFEQQVKAMAWDIVKKKNVNIKLLKASSTVEQYNNELIIVLGRWFAEREFLTSEEFELLKECLV